MNTTNKNSAILIKWLSFFLTLTIISFVYSFSLNREWQFFDERSLYNESIFPRPQSIAELFEVILNYAFSYHLDSQNAFFSNIITVRSNSLGAVLQILASLLFNKNSLYYHLLEVSIHLLNSIIIWFIFLTVLGFKNTKTSLDYIYASLVTLIWALHPANVEAVLLGTNWTSLLTYSLCLGLFLHTLKKIKNNIFKNSYSETFAIIFLFVISLMISEYSYALPLILFFVAFALSSTHNNLKKTFVNSFNICLPYFIGIFVYLGYSFIRSISTIKNQEVINQLFQFSFERTLWLSPQIFIHFLKMFFYPESLSLYQTNLLTLGDSLLHPYVLLCTGLILLLLVTPIVIKKSNYMLFLIYAFFVSLFPFLHIITPTYCLFAERYCYFPFFIFMFIVVTFLGKPVAHLKVKKSLILIFIIFLIPLTLKTIYRINEWKTSFSLYLSAANASKNSLYQGQIYSVLSYYFKTLNKKEETKKYALLSINKLEKAIKELELKAKKNTLPVQTLKLYGLDEKSLIVKSAFGISSSRFIYLNEPAEKVLSYYEPYIKNNLSYAGNSELNLYSRLLSSTNQGSKALEILELAKKKYPLSPIIISSLGNLFIKTNDLQKAETVIQEGFNYYPSYNNILLKKVKLATLKSNPYEVAKYEYLLGLRTHSAVSYQKAAQIYLALNRLNEAKIILDKLSYLDSKNPVTYLLLSKYYNLNGNQSKAFEALNNAYIACKNSNSMINLPIYKSIVLSLISFNLTTGSTENAKRYVNELEQIPGLIEDEKKSLSILKKKFNLE